MTDTFLDKRPYRSQSRCRGCGGNTWRTERDARCPLPDCTEDSSEYGDCYECVVDDICQDCGRRSSDRSPAAFGRNIR
jgi:hypothetical protein